MMSLLRRVGEGWVLTVHLTPNASRDEIYGLQRREDGEDCLKVKVRQVPEKGKANKALCVLLAKYFKLPKTSIEVISGHKSKTKGVLIRSGEAQLDKQLKQIIKNSGTE